MKKSDVKNQAIFMCGISGSGKTNFAHKLEKNGYLRLSTDALIWEKAGDKLISLSPDEQKALFTECREIVKDKFIKLLSSDKKVVVDATHCKRSVRDEIRKICDGLKVRPIFVYCYADKEELWNRLSKRKGTGPDDLIVTREELENYWLGFEHPQEDEKDFIFLNDSPEFLNK